VSRPGSGAPPALSIVGPTATGKTALACALARRAGDVELVSVDSMSVYRGMDVGTAKPTPEQRAAAPWHLLDLVDPSDEFSVADFQRSAVSVLAGIGVRGHRAVLVGGTGLYHRAVLDGLEIPPRFPAVAAELEAQAESAEALAALHLRLAMLDPLAASRMNPTNRRRVLRALEVTLGSGRPFSSFGPGLSTYSSDGRRVVGLRVPRDELAGRLAARLDEQVGAGFVAEVRALADRPGGLSRTARQALGYRELLAHVEEGVSLEAALTEALRRMRRFAKRQESWFGRDPRVEWLDARRDDLVEAAETAWLDGAGQVEAGSARE
jgi:tRNA dimethylallyltransferase